MSLVPLLNFTPVKAVEQLEDFTHGPRIDKVIFKIYTDPEAEYMALKSGEIDMVDWPLPAEKIDDAMSDPNLVVTETGDLGFFYIGINCKRWPLSDYRFRQALAHLVDKDKVVNEYLRGYGNRLDSVVSPNYGIWHNPNVTKYDFNPQRAKEILEEAGYVYDESEGKWYYENETGRYELPEMVILGRADDPYRKQLALDFAAACQSIGLPIRAEIVDRSVVAVKVYVELDYWMFTGGWSLGTDVDWLWFFFNSKAPKWANHVQFEDPECDYWTDKLMEAPTFEEVLEACWKIQEIVAEKCPYIPVYQCALIHAYRKGWTGIVPMVGSGILTGYTLLNIHPEGQEFGGILKIGMKSDIQSLNPITAEWYWDWLVLGPLYDSLIATNPYTLEDVPWMCKSFTMETWEEGLKITFDLYENITWHDGRPLTGEDVKFTFLWLQEIEAPRYIDYVKNIVKVELEGAYRVIVYLNTSSYFALHWIGGIPILPKHIWENVQDWEHFEPEKHGALIGSGPFMFKEYRPGEYAVLLANARYFRAPEGRPPVPTTTVRCPKGESKSVEIEVTHEAHPVENASVTVVLRSENGTEIREYTAIYNATLRKYVVTINTKALELETGTYYLYITITYTIGNNTYVINDIYLLEVYEPTPPGPSPLTIVAVVIVIIIIIAAIAYLYKKKPVEEATGE